VDDIAPLAGVGRRTVFRYFATREDLLRAALDKSFASYVSALPEYGGGDWLAWIAELTLVSHRSVASAGRLLWELRTRRGSPAPVDMSERVQRVFDDVTATLWRAAGGDGRPPRELRQTVAAHLSPMFTQAVLLDAGGTPELAAELASGAIAATVRQLLGR
jgi:AcrR family transcriptional regulator